MAVPQGSAGRLALAEGQHSLREPEDTQGVPQPATTQVLTPHVLIHTYPERMDLSPVTRAKE